MNKQLKLGIIFVISVVLLFWGINYLKGKNIFDSSKEFYVIYEKVGGLRKSNAVFINGFKIGVVSDIYFHPNHSGDIVVKFTVQSDFPFSKNSKIMLENRNIMGDKSLVIKIEPGENLALTGDTLRGEIESSMTDVLQNEMIPLKDKISHLVATIDLTMNDIKEIMNQKNKTNIGIILEKMTKTFGQLNKITAGFNTFFDGNKNKLSHIINNLDSISTNLTGITDSLNHSNLKQTIKDLNIILAEISSGKGSLGKMVKDPKVYNNLNKTLKEMYALIKDLKLNPSRYVNFSLFGGSERYEDTENKEE